MMADLEENPLDYLDEQIGMRRPPEPEPVDRATWGRTPEAIESQRRADELMRGRSET